MKKSFSKGVLALAILAIFFTPAIFSVNASSENIIGHYDFSTSPADRILADHKGSDTDALTNIPVAEIATVDDAQVYAQDGELKVQSSKFIPVNTANTYSLSGKFKSVAAVEGDAIKNSRLYFGVTPYNADKKMIPAISVFRTGTDAVVVSVTSTKINVETTLSEWYQTHTLVTNRSIGFYYDGNTSHLPDYVMTDATKGAYSTATETTIALNMPVPSAVASKIVPGRTVVKNHYTRTAYMYSAAGASGKPAVVEPTWTEYKAESISGEGFGENAVVFPPGTKYVKISLFLNYGQPEGTKVVFNEINLKELETGHVLLDQTNADNKALVKGDLTFINGKSGQAGNFDGVDDMAIFNSSTALNEQIYGFSWGAWIKAGSQSASEARILDFGDTSLVMGTGTGQKVKAWIKTGAVSNGVSSDAPLNDNQWHHVAVTWDGNIIKMYIDGEKQLSEVQATGDLSIGHTFTIGGEESGKYFQGALDEIKLYSTALPQNHIHLLSETEATYWEVIDTYLFHEGDVQISGSLVLEGDMEAPGALHIGGETTLDGVVKIEGNIVSDGDICIGNCS